MIRVVPEGCALIRPLIRRGAGCRAQEPRIGPVTRSFFEVARPARPRRSRRGIHTVQGLRHLFFSTFSGHTGPMAHLRMAAGRCVAAESWRSVRRRIRIVLMVLGPGGKPPRVGRSTTLVLDSCEA
jgi:hypothetical protein